jgi:RNA-directed DNA polymerase
MGKRMAAKLKEIKATLRKRLQRSLADTVRWLQSLVRGYFQYHAIPGNEVRLQAFCHDVLRLWMRQLRRRSQRSRWTWDRFLERFGALIPDVRILHPYPSVRFAATHPR